MVTQVMSTFQKPFRRGYQVAANLFSATPLRNQEVGGNDRAFHLAVPFVKHVAEPAGAVAYTVHVVNDQETQVDVVLHLPFVSRGIVAFLEKPLVHGLLLDEESAVSCEDSPFFQDHDQQALAQAGWSIQVEVFSSSQPLQIQELFKFLGRNATELGIERNQVAHEGKRAVVIHVAFFFRSRLLAISSSPRQNTSIGE